MKNSKRKLFLCFLDQNNEIKSSKDLGCLYDLNGDNKLIEDKEIENEIVNILLNQINIALKPDIIKDMIKEIVEEFK